jgi:hypothetical protein
MEPTKICKVCNLEKKLECFPKRKGKPEYRCKKCTAEYQKKYYKKNQEKIKERTSQFREKRPDYMIAWRENNKDKVYKQKREWFEKNRDKLNEQERQRRKKDHAYRIKKNLRRRINDVIKKPNKKHAPTFELLGCSLQEFLKHLEGQFVEGMNWSNYGNLWHIDHILPCASFDLTDPEQQKKCFHYTNLQPLWAIDNIRKRDKIL